jgi:hypothetical protein
MRNRNAAHGGGRFPAVKGLLLRCFVCAEATKHDAYRHPDRTNEPLVTTPLRDPTRRLSRPVRWYGVR